MKTLTSAEIRQKFLGYFEQKGHRIVPSSPLVPGNDPTLLFTNAGMVQFKDVFLGADKRDYNRAVTSQRCLRAGGKHNDLDQVGYTARHHTFFEMLGNFSFGDYFKQDAIRFAWEFLTGEIGLPADKLWVTVFEEDDEAEAIWINEIGVPKERVARIGAKDNFWAMGDTGPCGPCSEIFYDHGPDVAGGPPGTPEEDGDRYIEIWNLVFMQYDRDDKGELHPLPSPCVDTGMGLERLAAVLQHKHNNYDIDLFQKLIQAIATISACEDMQNPSLKVISDHIRACAFLIADGVLPGNEGRAYVLRRIIRRAIRHGYKLGIETLFFYRMVEPLAEAMGQAYPELIEKQAQIEKVLRQEEERFAMTLDHGMKILEQSIADLDGDTIPGDVVFKLYDTYGFPEDLTADVARERGLTLDSEGFAQAMETQRERARAGASFAGGEHIDADLVAGLAGTEFTGYSSQQESTCQVLAISAEGEALAELAEGQEGLVFLDKTPFYAESGGQVGDTGLFRSGNMSAKVIDTQKIGGQFFAHKVTVLSGKLAEGDRVEAVIDAGRRQAIRLNHSATHLMHAALRNVLGDHVQQKGSLVDDEKLRFDFSHFEPVSPEQLQTIERQVNEQIRSNNAAETAVMGYDDAVASGAMALFGEKYGDKVRVLRLGDYSVELCGGTHVERAGDIGLFKIVSESGVAAGVRRIEAITGENAVAWVEHNEQQINRLNQLLKAGGGQVLDKVQQLLDKSRELEKQLNELRSQMAGSAGKDLASSAEEIGDVKIICANLPNADAKALREAVDQLKGSINPCAVVLGSGEGDKVRLVAGVSKDLTDRIKAGELVNIVAVEVGGKGGGRPDLAQAGGNNPNGLQKGLEKAREWLHQGLQS